MTPLSSHLSLSSLLSLSGSEKEAFLSTLSPEESLELQYNWAFWARPDQRIPPGDWKFWLVKGGRGAGKTRTGAETVREKVEKGEWGRVALIAKRAADLRDIMIEGDSGILNISHPNFRPVYEPSKRRLTWPNGAIAIGYSDEEPEEMRGPQFSGGWCDELAKFPNAAYTWDNFEFGLRLGKNPQALITTTPQPTKTYIAILRDPATVVTSASTYANAAFLAPSFIERIKKYEGTRIGRQEIYAELLEDVVGALWTSGVIDEHRRLGGLPAGVSLSRVVVAIDPSTTNDVESAEAGIVVGGLGSDGDVYVLADLSLRGSPKEWADRAIDGYHRFMADRVIAEANNGGDMVEAVIQAACTLKGQANVPFKKIWASRGKATRAEPVATLYQQGQVHHTRVFDELERQMISWVPGMPSPDRMDALVWVVTELKLNVADPGRCATGGDRTAPRRPRKPTTAAARGFLRGMRGF